MTSDPGGNWTLGLFNISLRTALLAHAMETPALVLRESELADAGVLSLWTSVCPGLIHKDADRCSMNRDVLVWLHFSPLLVDSI